MDALTKIRIFPTGMRLVQATDPRLSNLMVFLDAGIRTHFPLGELSPLSGTGDPSLAPGLDQNGKDLFTYGTMKGAVAKVPSASYSRLSAQVQDTLMATLSIYKCPRTVQFVDELPRTATGKIQKFRLRELLKAGRL